MEVPESPHEHEKIERLRRAMYSRTLSEKLKDKQRRALSDPRAVVGDDFVKPEERLAQMTVAPRAIGLARQILSWILIFSVVFFIGAVGFFAYYFTLGGGSTSASAANVDITVAGPPQIPGGERTNLQIVVTNRNTVPLQLAELVFAFPSGTRDTDQTDMLTRRVSLGTIQPGESKQGEISAIFTGAAGSRSDVKVELEYRLDGSNSIFVASTEYELVFGTAPLTISLDGDNQTISGQPMQLVVTVKSNTSEPLRNVLLRADYPFGFSLDSSDPSSDLPGTWELGTLNPGGSKTITLRGSLKGESGDARTFRFTAGIGSATSTAITTAFAEIAKQTSITQKFLGLNISVAGASGPTIASPGDNVPVTITYQNNLPTAVQDAVIVARLSGAQIDGSSVRAGTGFYRSSDSSILWDKTTTAGALESIAPGAKGTLQFTFKMPSTADLQGIANPKIVFSINASGKRPSETNVPENLQSAITQTLGIASDLGLAAQGLYYANPFSSTGPIPPKAGTETTYAIVFTVTNTTNQITQAKLTAHLPPYVRWLGSYAPASENVVFNQSNGTVTWNIGTIDAGTGVGSSAPRQAAISVGFTPSTSQIGEQPALIQQILLSGVDASKAAIQQAANPGFVPTPYVLQKVGDVTTNLAQVRKSSDGMMIGIDPGFTATNGTVVK